LKSIIIDKNDLNEFLKILLHVGEDEIVKDIDPSLIDLCDTQQYDFKFDFSFGGSIPKDIIKSDSQQSNSESDAPYLMVHSPRGKCYIINNYFTIGTYKETQRFRNIFYQLHFDVIIEKNKTAKEIVQRLNEFARLCEDEEHDAFIFMIITPKNRNNEMLGFDDEAKKIDDLIQIFSDEKCPKMKKKPRLFFFNFCSSNGKLFFMRFHYSQTNLF
jgi:hypothetical protein